MHFKVKKFYKKVLQKNTASKGDSYKSRSNIRSFTDSISSANSRLSSSISHSRIDSSFCKSPSNKRGFPFLEKFKFMKHLDCEAINYLYM